MRRDFDTLKYSVEHYEDRPGRRSIDTRRFVGRVSDEKSFTDAWSAREDDGRERKLADMNDGTAGDARAAGTDGAADVTGAADPGGESTDE